MGSPPVATRPPHSPIASGMAATSLKFGVAQAGLRTQAVAQRGGRALVIGLAWGHDVGEAKQCAYLFALMKRIKLRYVWLAFPCTAFCCWVRPNRSQGCDLAEQQREGKRHLRTTPQAAQLQKRLGGHVALESPHLAGLARCRLISRALSAALATYQLGLTNAMRSWPHRACKWVAP